MPVDEPGWREQVLQCLTPVLVEVTGPGNEPCRLFNRVVDELAEELGDRLKVVRIVINDRSHIVRRYDITALPTVLVFEGGVEVRRLVGARGKRRLLEELHLA